MITVSKIYIGIDNGVSGTISIIKPEKSIFILTPVSKHLNFQKTKKTNINRLDFMKVCKLFALHTSGKKCFVVIERPLVNSRMFSATMSAVRCLEATLIALETYSLPYEYIDSRAWQKELLPGTKGSANLKEASTEIGCRLFPEHEKLIRKHKDADGLLIAEYARRHAL